MVIYLPGRFFWLDSVLSVLVAVVMAFGASRLLGDVMRALRTATLLDLNDD